MSKLLNALSVSLLALAVSGVAQADDRMSKDDAQALVKKVIAKVKSDGKEKALAACNSPEFYMKADGYIFAYDLNGVNVCHKNEKMRGRNLIDMKDANGVLLIQEMIKACKSKEGSGWIQYDWPNAVSKQVEPKTSYAELHDGVCWASGFSRPK
jgi:signal transduction histidine kinase